MKSGETVADGSVKIDVKLDTTGIDDEINKLQDKLAKIGKFEPPKVVVGAELNTKSVEQSLTEVQNSADKTSGIITAAFQGMENALTPIPKTLGNIGNDIKKLESPINQTTDSFKKLGEASTAFERDEQKRIEFAREENARILEQHRLRQESTGAITADVQAIGQRLGLLTQEEQKQQSLTQKELERANARKQAMADMQARHQQEAQADAQLHADAMRRIDHRVSAEIKASQQIVKALEQRVETKPVEPVITQALKNSVDSTTESLGKISQVSQEVSAKSVMSFSQAESAIKRTELQIEKLKNRMGALRQVMEKPITVPEKVTSMKEVEAIEQASKNARQASTEYGRLEQKLKELSGTLGFYKEQQSMANKEKLKGVEVSFRMFYALKFIERSISAFGKRVRQAFGNAVRFTGRLIKNLFTVNRSMKQTTRETNKANSAFGKLNARLIGLAVTAMVFNQIRRKLREYVRYVNEALMVTTEFRSALALLKGSALTAFQPFFEVIVPILLHFVNLLAKAMQYLAVMASYFFKLDPNIMKKNAKAMWENVKASKAGAKALERFLAPFDELIVVSSKAEDTDMSDLIPDFDFELPEVPEWFKKLLDWLEPLWDALKNMAQEFWNSLVRMWERHGEAIVEAWKRAMTTVRDLLIDVMNDLARLFASATWDKFLDEVARTLILIADLIHYIGDAFRKAWNENDRGYNMLLAITRAMTSILGFANDIGEAFIKAWNENERGVRIFAFILQIITNIANFVENLVERFRVAWNENELGVRIWGHILDLLLLVLGFIDRITKSTAEWAKTLNASPLLESVERLLIAFNKLATVILDSLADAWENTLLPMFTKLAETTLPAVIDWIANAFERLAEWIKENDVDIGSLIMKISTAVTVFGLLAGIIVPLLAKAALTGFAFALLGKSAIALLIPFAKIIAVIAGIVAVFLIVKKAIDDGIIDFENLKMVLNVLWEVVKGVFRGIVAAVKGAFNLIMDILEPFLYLLGGIIDFLVGVFTGDWETAWQGIGKIVVGIVDYIVTTMLELPFIIMEIGWDIINGLFGGILDGMPNPFTWIRENIFAPIIDALKGLFGIKSPSTVMAEIGGWIIEGMLEGISKLIENVIKLFTDIWNGITDVFKNVGEWFTDKFKSAKDGVEKAWSGTKQFFTNRWNDVKDAFSNAREWFTETGRATITNMSNAMTKAKSTVVNAAQTIGNSVQNFFSGLVNNMKTIGSNLMSGLANGISSMASAVFNVVSNIASSVINTVSGIFGVKSPSVVFAKIGQFLMQGLFKGMEDEEDSPIMAIEHMLDSWRDLFKGFVDDVLVEINRLYEALTAISDIQLKLPEMPRGGLISGSTISALVEKGRTMGGEYGGAVDFDSKRLDDLYAEQQTTNSLLEELIDAIMNQEMAGYFNEKLLLRIIRNGINDSSLQAGKVVFKT